MDNPEQKSQPRRIGRWAWRVGRSLLLIYPIWVFVLWLAQDRLVFPRHVIPGGAVSRMVPQYVSEITLDRPDA